MGTEIKKSDVFVLVPSYNHARYVEKCLRSIIAQTVSPARLLVIDDGSGDGSPIVIERVLKECPFDAELVVRSNRGLCATLNEGLERSSGEHFAYIGSDDMWSPRFIEARCRLLSQRPAAVLAYGHAYLIDDDDEITDSSERHADDWAFFPDGDPMPMLSYGTSPVSSTVMYRRSALDGLKWNESARLEDYEMYLRLAHKGEFAFDPTVLSAWRRHGANTSGDIDMMLGEILAAQDRALESGFITAEERDTAGQRTRFRFARELLQNGRKAGALKLASGNFEGARSTKEKATFGLRMLVPMGIVELRRNFHANRPKIKIQERF